MLRVLFVMGDQRLAEIRTEEGSLYFYTHSMGSRLPDDARRALEFASARRGDTMYALRIIVDQLTNSSGSRDSHLGSGLMLVPSGEDEYGGDPCSVVIDLMRWTVTTDCTCVLSGFLRCHASTHNSNGRSWEAPARRHCSDCGGLASNTGYCMECGR